MNVLSLFDGVSCAYAGLKKSGVKVNQYFACEIDKYAIHVSNKNHPDIIRLVNDVREMKASMLPSIDLLVGGSPCTDLSIAKKNREGLKGSKSSLFWEYVRLFKEVKPKYFILENVASMPKEDKDLISETMGVQPVMFNASLVSAQSRKRLFWTNLPFDLPDDKGILLKDILQENVDECFFINRELNVREKKQFKNDTEKSMCLSASMYKGSQNNGMTLVRVGHIGNTNAQPNRVYSPDGKTPTLTTSVIGLYEIDGRIRKLTPIECERLQGLPDDYTAGISKTQRYKCLGNAFNVDVIACIVSTLPSSCDLPSFPKEY